MATYAPLNLPIMGPKPNKEQALYALILTQHTLLFLSKIISSKWKNSEW